MTCAGRGHRASLALARSTWGAVESPGELRDLDLECHPRWRREPEQFGGVVVARGCGDAQVVRVGREGVEHRERRAHASPGECVCLIGDEEIPVRADEPPGLPA